MSSCFFFLETYSLFSLLLFVTVTMAALTFLTLIAWWLFACYWLIVKTYKSIKDEFDAIIPYQFIVWILLLLFFIYDIVTLRSTIQLFQASIFRWLLQLMATLSKWVLWFILSYSMITKYILTAPTDTKEKTDALYNMLIWLQVTFGIIALVLWVIWLIALI